MEEAVTRKFVHADSSHIISFCGKCVFVLWCLLIAEFIARKLS